eukprot:5251347-Heterocapsa_arctica.AAC.1
MIAGGVAAIVGLVGAFVVARRLRVRVRARRAGPAGILLAACARAVVRVFATVIPDPLAIDIVHVLPEARGLRGRVRGRVLGRVRGHAGDRRPPPPRHPAEGRQGRDQGRREERGAGDNPARGESLPAGPPRLRRVRLRLHRQEEVFIAVGNHAGRVSASAAGGVRFGPGHA